MSYKLFYTKTAGKDIEKLDRVIKKRLKKKLEEFSGNPLFYAKPLTNSKLGDYRLRVGNYRIIFDVDGKNIILLRIRHRREVYRK